MPSAILPLSLRRGPPDFPFGKASDLLSEHGEIPFHDILQGIGLNLIIRMNQNIPRADNSAPRNFVMNQAIRFPQLVRRFTNDFEVAADGVHNHRFRSPVPALAGSIAEDFADGFQHMSQVETRESFMTDRLSRRQRVSRRQSGSASARTRSRITG